MGAVNDRFNPARARHFANFADRHNLTGQIDLVRN